LFNGITQLPEPFQGGVIGGRYVWGLKMGLNKQTIGFTGLTAIQGGLMGVAIK
jgi:hypothetical protein